MYKSGTGTRGRGRGTGTWDLRTSSMGRGDAGTTMIIEKSEVNADISHFPREYVLVKATHIALLRVPPCLFTKRRLGEDSVH